MIFNSSILNVLGLKHKIKVIIVKLLLSELLYCCPCRKWLFVIVGYKALLLNLR